jgi:hypothetical protein
MSGLIQSKWAFILLPFITLGLVRILNSQAPTAQVGTAAQPKSYPAAELEGGSKSQPAGFGLDSAHQILAAEMRALGQQVGAVYQVDMFSGANLGAKISACLSALPSSGGVCDARNLSGSQSITRTITPSKNQEIDLGCAQITATVVPVFVLTDVDQLRGCGWRDNVGYGTTVSLSGTTGGAAVRLASYGNGGNTPAGSAVNFSIRDIEFIGLSTTDGSYGLDLQGGQLAAIQNVRLQRFQTGIRRGWGTYSWNCDCYNRMDHVQFVAVGTGLDDQPSTNGNTSVDITSMPFGTGGTGARLGGWANVYDGLDVENFSGGIAIDLAGSANTVSLRDIEGGGTPIQVESSASYNSVIGGSMSSLSAPINWAKGSDQITNQIERIQNGPLWPMTLGAFAYQLGQGSSSDFYSLVGKGTGGATFQYTPGSQAQTAYGLTGPAPLTIGALNSFMAQHNALQIYALANPAAPTITNVGAAGGTSYKYAIVCHSANHRGLGWGYSTVSGIGQTPTGNVHLSKGSYNVIAYSCPNGYTAADILKYVGGIWQALYAGNNDAPSGTYNDQGQSTLVYTLPTRNTTGDESVQGNLTQQNGLAVPITVASGSLALATSAIAAGACQAVMDGTVNSAAATGVTTTDVIEFTPNKSIKTVTGHVPGITGGLTIMAYPTSGYVNFDVCNWSNASIAPGPVTLNWRVTR